jgi:hypothetical protein
MCEFISWIEKDDKVLFLTYDDIYHTKKGKELQKHCKNSRDYTGHGAIGYFYNLSENTGTNKECTDFTSPDNFPSDIVKAIKLGQFTGLGLSKDLLTEQAYAEYVEIRQAAFAEYMKIQQAAYAKYEEIQQQAHAEYEEIQQAAYVKYEEIQQVAYAECEEIQQAV